MKIFNVNYEVFTKKECNSKFVIIGDLHGWINNKTTRNVIKNINDQKPDIIMIAGDILSKSDKWLEKSALKSMQSLLRSLSENGADIVTILGNHDTRVLNDEILKNYLSLGDIERVYPLHNSSVDLNKNNESIHISGLSTSYLDSFTYETNKLASKNETDPRPQRIIQTLKPLLNLDENQINILLSHDPRQLRIPSVDIITKNFDVRIAAHVHNGYLPFSKTTTNKNFLDQDWKHYLLSGMTPLNERNFARGIAYGNNNLYILCTQTGDYFLVKYNDLKKDNEYMEVTWEEAIDIIKENNLIPSIITGGINRYANIPFDGSEVTSFKMKTR